MNHLVPEPGDLQAAEGYSAIHFHLTNVCMISEGLVTCT